MKTDGSTAILMASFGTTHPDALERCIAGTERSVAARFPGYPVYRAFTSSMVIRRLKQRHGIAVDTVGEALERMKADGVRRVAVPPSNKVGCTPASGGTGVHRPLRGNRQAARRRAGGL